MFRLLKLAALALFGYAIYEFFRGMAQDTRFGAAAGEAFGRFDQGRHRDERGRFTSRQGSSRGGANISGPGEGVEEATLDNDGGSVSHKVGRGVIS